MTPLKIVKIWNSHTVPKDVSAVYVGRPSEWGNPFSIGPDGNRSEVMEKYSEWIWQPEQKALRNRMRQVLRNQDLMCWCDPLPCHAIIIADIAASSIEP